MKGIGKRVTIGFLSIVVLLLASGMFSLFELNNLSYDTQAILEAGGEDMEVAKRLLRASNDHSRAVQDIAIFDDTTKIQQRDKAMADIAEQIHLVKEAMTKEAQVQQSLVECTDSLAMYANRMESASRDEKSFYAADREKSYIMGRAWYRDVYEPIYNDFVEQTKRYMSLSHGQLAPRAEQLSRNAHRAIAPVLISLLVMIAVVLMLFYFIYVYGVSPIVRINKSLSGYISFKMPYSVKGQLIDEIKELYDNIDTLITSSKSNK